MAIKAWLSIRSGKDVSGLKKRGDVICVRLKGSRNTSKEEARFLIIEDWEDTQLERQLRDMQAAGERNPIIVHPYAEYNPPDPITDVVTLKTRSTKFVDVDSLADADQLLDRSKRVHERKQNTVRIQNRTR